MFNPEKMLGSLLMGGLSRKRGLGGLLSGGAALGLAGVAMEAAEHFMNSAKQKGSAPPPVPPGGQGAPPPPPPSPPPGPPTAAPSIRPMAPAPSAEQAVLLIRAMIAAANADGVIDETERSRILAKLDAAQLDPEERSFMEAELTRPRSAEEIVAEAVVAEAVADEVSPDMARQVYLVSLLAVDVDTPQERTYLETLAGLLGLDAAMVAGLHKEAAVAPVD